MHSFFKPAEINIQDGVIVEKLVDYLNLVKKRGDYDPAIVDYLIKTLPYGYCSAFASVAGYGQWLEVSEPMTARRTDNQGQPIPRDDWTWLKSTLEDVAKWNGKSLPSKALENDIERLISLLEFYHHIGKYLPIGQGELQKGLQDTRGRTADKEYSLGGLLTLERLKTILPQILHEDRLMLIDSHSHAISLFMHKGEIYVFNSGNPRGKLSLKSEQIGTVADYIFEAMKFDSAIPSPLGLRVFNFGQKQSTPYPKHDDLLGDLPLTNNVDNYAGGVTAAMISAKIGCVSSLEFYGKPANIAGLNAKNNQGVTAVLLAAQNGHADALYALARSGADLNQKTSKGDTPALVAADHGHADALRILAEAGADLNQKNNDGDTPTLEAAYYGHADALRILAEEEAKKGPDACKKLLNQENRNGFTPVFMAAEKGHVGVLQLLAEKGVDLNQTIKNGITPVMLATEHGHANALRLLAEEEAKKGPDACKKLLNQEYQNGLALVFMAAAKGHVGVLQLLAEKGVDLNQTKNGITPIMLAAENGHANALRLLAEEEAKKGPDACKKLLDQETPSGFAPVFLAAAKGHVGVLQLLVEKGVDLNQTKNGTTTVMLATEHGQANALRLLAEEEAKKGPDACKKLLDQENRNGIAPVLMAAHRGHVDILQLLAEKGADLNKADKEGATPSMIAIKTGHIEALVTLAKNGANLNIANPEGVTPALMLADMWRGKADDLLYLLKSLKETGADLTIPSNGGITIAKIAENRGYTAVSEYLLQQAPANIYRPHT